MNDDAITTARSVFLHREIFHLKPRKDDLFHAHLSRQYNDTTTSQNDLLSQPLPRNEDNTGDIANTNANREGRIVPNVSNNRRSIIDMVRQMNGCYSFEIYCRTDDPLEDHEGHGEEIGEENEEERFSEQGNGILSCSSASPEPALSSDSSSHIQPARDATTLKPASLSLLEKKEENETDETAVVESSGSNEIPTPRTNNGLIEATSEYGHLKKPPPDEDEETKEKKDPVGRLPHQFMVLGRWESSASYYLFYVNRAVQKFFCPLISRKVIMSLPILTMWQKENGVHRQMHYSTVTEGLRNSEGGNLHPTVPLSISDGSLSSAVGNDTPNHFVMSRKRVLKDPANMDDALAIAKGLAASALKEDGCLAYDICKTGNTMFNENEMLEIGIWESPHHFVIHNKQSYRGLHITLHQLFDLSQEETSFWERPNFAPLKSSDNNK